MVSLPGCGGFTRLQETFVCLWISLRASDHVSLWILTTRTCRAKIRTRAEQDYSMSTQLPHGQHLYSLGFAWVPMDSNTKHIQKDKHIIIMNKNGIQWTYIYIYIYDHIYLAIPSNKESASLYFTFLKHIILCSSLPACFHNMPYIPLKWTFDLHSNSVTVFVWPVSILDVAMPSVGLRSLILDLCHFSVIQAISIWRWCPDRQDFVYVCLLGLFLVAATCDLRCHAAFWPAKRNGAARVTQVSRCWR